VTLVTVLRIRRPTEPVAGVGCGIGVGGGLAVASPVEATTLVGLPQASYTVVLVTVAKTAPFRVVTLDVFCETYGK